MMLLSLLWGCDAAPDRNTAAKLLEATEWEALSVQLDRAGTAFLSSGIETPALLIRFTQDGYLLKTFHLYQSGAQRYPGQRNFSNHEYWIWTPAEKLKPYIVEYGSENHCGVTYAKRRLVKVTGMTKVDESSYLVIYESKMVANEIGEMLAQHWGRSNDFSGPIFGDERAISKKLDDGWRILKR